MANWLNVSLMAAMVLLSGCAQSMDAKVVQGEHGWANPYLARQNKESSWLDQDCPYEGFEQNRTTYGIYKVVNGPPPVEGATVSGDWNGFGKRQIRNASSNENVTVDVTYHADNYDAITNELQSLGCKLSD